MCEFESSFYEHTSYIIIDQSQHIELFKLW